MRQPSPDPMTVSQRRDRIITTSDRLTWLMALNIVLSMIILVAIW